MLVEKTGILGGTIVTAAVNAPASFRAYGKQVIAGIGWELCCRVLRECGDPIPDPEAGVQEPGRPQSITVNPAVFAAMCDEAAVDANVDVLFHAMPAAATRTEDVWK